MTNLVRNPKFKIDEVEKARNILQGIHILNNPKHYKVVVVNVFAGYDEATGQPIYSQQAKKVPKFPKTFHKTRSSFYAFVNTAASTNGFRVNMAISNKIMREETTYERNDKKQPFFGRKQNNQY